MKQHMSNASWGGIAAGFRAGYGLLNLLLAVRLLGPEAYGQVVPLLALFALYCSLTTSIFTMLVVKLMATTSEPQRCFLLTSGQFWVFFSLVVLAIFSLLCGLLVSRPIVYLLLGMSGLTAIQIIGAFQLAMIESVGRFDNATKSQLLGPFIILLILLAALLGNIRLTSFFYVLILCAGASVDLYLAWGTRRKIVNLNIAHRALNLTHAWHGLRQLLKSGSLLQASSLMNMFLEPLNKILLNSFLDGMAVTIYDLCMKLIWGIQNLFSSAMRVFLHIASQDREQIECSYIKVIRLISVPVLLLHVLACSLLTIFARHWLSLDLRELTTFFAVATLSNLGMIGVGPLYNALIGAENMRFIFRIQASLAVTNVVASLCLIPFMGVLGAAAGLLLATLYNVLAIFQKSKELLGNNQIAKRVVSNMGRRSLWAVLLFLLAVYLGIDGVTLLSLEFLVLICALIMLSFEPVTGYLLGTLKRSDLGH